MSDDLVKRARDFCVHTPLSKPMITKLADRIEELQARVAELEAERKVDHDNINLKADFIEKTINQLAAEQARAEAAEARLATARRDALEAAAEELENGMSLFAADGGSVRGEVADSIRALADDPEARARIIKAAEDRT